MLIPAGQLPRVYVGVGWREKNPQQTLDVDCCAAAYYKGNRLDDHTVSWQHLRNSKSSVPDGKGGNIQAATIVHTGDILTGQKGADGLIDQERIYCYLAHLPVQIETMAFETNIYTPNQRFEDLESAYCRIVNADTNQELCRVSLDANSKGGLGGRVIIVARLRRVSGYWEFVASCESADHPLKDSAAHQPSMIPQHLPPPPPPPPPPPGVVNEEAPQKEDAAPVSNSYSCVPVAAGTATGIAASVAIFATGALAVHHFQPDLFSAGVDFASLAVPDMSMVGTALSSVGGGIGEFAVDAGGAILDAGGGVIGAIGDSGAIGAIADVGSAAGGAIVDGAGSVVGAIGDSGAIGVVGDAAGAVGGVAMEAGGAVGGVAMEAGGAVGGVAMEAGGAVGGVAMEAGGAIGGVAMEVGGAIGGVAMEAGGAIGDVGSTICPAICGFLECIPDLLGPCLGAIINILPAIGDFLCNILGAILR